MLIMRPGWLFFLLWGLPSFVNAQPEWKNEPFPNDHFCYQLSLKKEAILGGSGAVFLAAGGYLHWNQPSLRIAHFSGLTPHQLRAPDRSAAYNHSPLAARLSNFTGFTILGAAGATTLLLGKNHKENFTLAVLYGEALLFNAGITLMVKNAVDRKRPILYHPQLTAAIKLEGGSDNLRSFWSGHTSVAFCSAVFLSKIYSDLHPARKSRFLVWGGSLLMATTTAYLRFEAGKHFPTDLIAGAFAGSLIGYGVPHFHRKRKTKNGGLTLFFTPAGKGLVFQTRWKF